MKCPYNECGEGVDGPICTGCRIDHEIEKATPTPRMERWVAVNTCRKHGGCLHKPLACPDCWKLEIT